MPVPYQHSETVSRQKATLLISLVAGGWLLAKAISWKVWLKERQFPLVPLYDWINWPSWVHYILFAASIGMLVFLIIKPLHKQILIALLITELVSCIADQNRWQPWQYQYLFTLLICILNHQHTKNIIAGIAFVMAATYWYSGLGKINEAYLALTWDNIFLKKLFRLSEALIQQKTIHYSGYLTALAEMVCAIGLFFSKWQKAAAWVLIGMHALILLAIGPWGIKYNVIVWPWNMLMMLLLFFLFIRNHFVPIPLKALWTGRNKLILICWGLLPALNYVGAWDSYLSCRLYSGNLPQMVFCIHNSNETQALAPYISKKDIYQVCNGGAMVNVQLWAMKEMNVPPYPEMRVYKKIKKQWLLAHPGSNSNIIYYRVVKQKEIKKFTAE